MSIRNQLEARREGLQTQPGLRFFLSPCVPEPLNVGCGLQGCVQAPPGSEDGAPVRPIGWIGHWAWTSLWKDWPSGLRVEALGGK